MVLVMNKEAWECTRCNKINAPFMLQCLCRKPSHSEIEKMIGIEAQQQDTDIYRNIQGSNWYVIRWTCSSSGSGG